MLLALADRSPDLHVPVHDNHERAEVGIETAIGGSRVGYQLAAVVDLGRLGTSRLVRPVAVASLAVPVEVPARAHDQGYQVAFVRALVVRIGRVDELVGYRPRAYLLTRDLLVLRVGRKTRLGVSVGSVIARIVVAVVVQLDLAAIVPPLGFPQGSAAALDRQWPARRSPGKLLQDVPKTLDLVAAEVEELRVESSWAEWARRTTDEILDERIDRNDRSARARSHDASSQHTHGSRLTARTAALALRRRCQRFDHYAAVPQ